MIKNRYNSLINKSRGIRREKEEATLSRLRRLLRKQIEDLQKKNKEDEELNNLSEP